MLALPHRESPVAGLRQFLPPQESHHVLPARRGPWGPHAVFGMMARPPQASSTAEESVLVGQGWRSSCAQAAATLTPSMTCGLQVSCIIMCKFSFLPETPGGSGSVQASLPCGPAQAVDLVVSHSTCRGGDRCRGQPPGWMPVTFSSQALPAWGGPPASPLLLPLLAVQREGLSLSLLQLVS